MKIQLAKRSQGIEELPEVNAFRKGQAARCKTHRDFPIIRMRLRLKPSAGREISSSNLSSKRMRKFALACRCKEQKARQLISRTINSTAFLCCFTCSERFDPCRYSSCYMSGICYPLGYSNPPSDTGSPRCRTPPSPRSSALTSA